MRKLERKEMKNLMGGLADAGSAGGSCSMTYQNSNGNWITETGQCNSNCQALLTVVICNPFCETASFHAPVQLTSNGGVSRCGAYSATNIQLF